MRNFPSAVLAAFLVTSTLLCAAQTASTIHAVKTTRAQKNQLLGTHRHSKRRVSAARASQRVSASGVVIYNGNQRQTRIFSPADPVAPVQRLSPAVIRIVDAGSKTQPLVVGVSSSAAPQGAASSSPVVVNIASAGSSSQPVVLGVASTGFQSAGAVPPVAVGISPRPAKRPPYRPAALDRQ
jgi:hypothetical protein